jgi:hypothetical protein
MATQDQPSPPIEITISVYFITEDPALAYRITEAMNRVATGFALEGGVSTAVRVGTCELDEQDDGGVIA